MAILHLYQRPGLSKSALAMKLREIHEITPLVKNLETEKCYNVEVDEPLNTKEHMILRWLLSNPLHPDLSSQPFLQECIEIGPRLNFSTPFSTNAVSICRGVGLKIKRLEVSVRFKLIWETEEHEEFETRVGDVLYDRMTQCIYSEPIKSFSHNISPQNWFYIDVLERGRTALEEVNSKLGLAFDDWDLDFYTKLFKNTLKRNPTSVECFDLAQSNSEHSRHWFFKGKFFIDGVEQNETLFEMITKTQDSSNPNNIIKFSDNSSAIEGFEVDKLYPRKTDGPSEFVEKKKKTEITFTAETHNFPTGVSPFSGATTGTGGRIRDVQAVGRGGHCVGGTAGYSVGNLQISGYKQPWENPDFLYPGNLATPLQILIEASNGASDYGNKFGEPVVGGFTRSFGLIDPNGDRREWVKPIMFSGGFGQMEAESKSKLHPAVGMKVAKIGGPVYRIGVGGGSASSIQVQGDNKTDLDFGAVQRGDAEMENKLNRLIRACIENPQGNPICSIHDQGAGGNGNVLKELVEPQGAVVFLDKFTLGDNSLSTMEIWGAEYQESNAILLQNDRLDELRRISQRERCSVDFVGTVTGNGKMIVAEKSSDIDEDSIVGGGPTKNQKLPFNLDLELVIGKMPQKEFHLTKEQTSLCPISLPSEVKVLDCLNRVLRLVTVSSKRFLTNKVDRSVTGLIAQQQCVGPLHTPLADCAVSALSMLSNEGVVTAIGEQPIKGLLDPGAGARMTVAESLTNLMFSRITNLKDVKCSGNWMWAAKLPGEGSRLYHACKAMCSMMTQLGIAIDGGKDSLSMAARVGDQTVKAPGTLVVSTYAPCNDVTMVVTPDIKSSSRRETGSLLWISLSSKRRLGGSALAQVFSQIGDQVPDIESPDLLGKGFCVTQELLSEMKILAGHDISDGGLLVCVLEMGFGGLSGLELSFDLGTDPIATLFAEEAGWVVEVSSEDVGYVTNKYEECGLVVTHLGRTSGFGLDSQVKLMSSLGEIVLCEKLATLFSAWEETSYKLECRQANAECVTEEFLSLNLRKGPSYKVSFNPDVSPTPSKLVKSLPQVAVIREEGTNGDREMITSLHMAGFQVWDVTMQDLIDGRITTDQFRGIVFPGGFSFADVLGSAKGWAGVILFNPKVQSMFTAFAKREDTFSLGVCNGCQLMSLLGWVGEDSTDPQTPSVVLDHNTSDRYECRFSSVRIEKSPSIMTKGMEGSILGVWVAHGEGRFTYKSKEVENWIQTNNCIPFKYCDDDGNPTELYPMNPNGSPGGVAGICSRDGRHLAFMPHPERCTVKWQWPYISPGVDFKVSPWLRLFQNAYVWAVENEI